MQKKKNQRIVKRRNPKNKQRKDDVQDLDLVGKGNLRVRIQRRGLVIPDQYTQTFIYAEQQRNIFTTAVAFDSLAWRMTDLNQFRTGVAPTIINGLTDSAGILQSDASRMRRYRVQKVHFFVRIQSRELVNPQTLILHPSQNAAAVSSAAEVQWLMQQTSNCIRTVGPVNSGHSVQNLKMSYNPEKLFGEQYHEQDEYSGALTLSTIGSPSTLAYMGLSFHNVNTNTAATGGCVLTLVTKLDVLFYQPDRDEDPATFRTLENDIKEMERRLLDMRVRARSLEKI